MKLIYTFLFLVSITLVSCDNYKSGHKSGDKNSHEYYDDDDYSELDDVITQQENPDRNNWQKPKEVIKRMGDLSDKVVADIGAGSGYFSFQLVQKAKKVIAIDIDSKALAQIDTLAKLLPTELQSKLETKLVGLNDPMLGNQEVDVAFFSNTYSYLNNKVDYLKTVFEELKPKGRIYIVDFKMKILPPIFPKAELRVPLFEVERHLQEAGFRHVFSDDRTLDYQYIVIAEKE